MPFNDLWTALIQLFSAVLCHPLSFLVFHAFFYSWWFPVGDFRDPSAILNTYSMSVSALFFLQDITCNIFWSCFFAAELSFLFWKRNLTFYIFLSYRPRVTAIFQHGYDSLIERSHPILLMDVTYQVPSYFSECVSSKALLWYAVNKSYIMLSLLFIIKYLLWQVQYYRNIKEIFDQGLKKIGACNRDCH